jgi:hypothetical protein
MRKMYLGETLGTDSKLFVQELTEYADFSNVAAFKISEETAKAIAKKQIFG